MCGRKKCVGDTSAYSFIHSMVCPCSAPGTVLGIREASGQVQGRRGLHRGDLQGRRRTSNSDRECKEGFLGSCLPEGASDFRSRSHR